MEFFFNIVCGAMSRANICFFALGGGLTEINRLRSLTIEKRIALIWSFLSPTSGYSQHMNKLFLWREDIMTSDPWHTELVDYASLISIINIPLMFTRNFMIDWDHLTKPHFHQLSFLITHDHPLWPLLD